VFLCHSQKNPEAQITNLHKDSTDTSFCAQKLTDLALFPLSHVELRLWKVTKKAPGSIYDLIDYWVKKNQAQSLKRDRIECKMKKSFLSATSTQDEHDCTENKDEEGLTLISTDQRSSQTLREG
jgi:hypothetical protein